MKRIICVLLALYCLGCSKGKDAGDVKAEPDIKPATILRPRSSRIL